MRSLDFELQARAFLDFFVRVEESIDRAFEIWAGSKDFVPDEKIRILTAAHTLLRRQLDQNHNRDRA